MNANLLLGLGLLASFCAPGSEGSSNELKLKQVALVKTNFPEADFWLQRRGSKETVGKVSRIYSNPEDIGIKIKSDYLSVIDPRYLSYVFEHLFNEGVFHNLSQGTLKLQHIRVRDVENIPMSFGSGNMGSMNKTPRRIRKKIIKDAEKIYKRKYARKCANLISGGSCPFWALAVIEAGKKNGRRLFLQAGSLQWRFVPPQLDDGISATHYSYMWSPYEPLSRRAIEMGMLPEVHVWVGDPQTQELIDLSTREIKSLAQKRGLKWKTANPPKYLWLTREEVQAHPDAYYQPNREATLFVYDQLQKSGLL